MYEQGLGDGIDYSKAVYWYQKAAEHNYPSAMIHLGHMYENGKGVSKDQKRAEYWYQRAKEMT